MLIRTRWCLQRRDWVTLTNQYGGIAEQAQIDNAKAKKLEQEAKKKREDEEKEKQKRMDAALVLWDKIKAAGAVCDPCVVHSNTHTHIHTHTHMHLLTP